MPDAGKYKPYFESYFNQSTQAIKYVIDLFRKQKTDFTEIAATLLACHWELKEKDEVINKEKLLKLFYAWSEKKERFNEKTVLMTWEWVKDNQLVVDCED